MNIEVIPLSEAPEQGRHNHKHLAIYEALATLGEGQALRISPCPGAHTPSDHKAKHGYTCSLNASLAQRRARGLVTAHVVHRDGAVYLYKDVTP